MPIVRFSRFVMTKTDDYNAHWVEIFVRQKTAAILQKTLEWHLDNPKIKKADTKFIPGSRISLYPLWGDGWDKWEI